MHSCEESYLCYATRQPALPPKPFLVLSPPFSLPPLFFFIIVNPFSSGQKSRIPRLMEEQLSKLILNYVVFFRSTHCFLTSKLSTKNREAIMESFKYNFFLHKGIPATADWIRNIWRKNISAFMDVSPSRHPLTSPSQSRGLPPVASSPSSLFFPPTTWACTSSSSLAG